ncbi:hypothetical protein HII28_10430 [Planctomonas sp. JC2975]|uniref:hypothetical protein n=1 Tax=Planctomonas sp. JC2975 TaxID=2729626 RepID=UPI001475B316|nr:hypothetical protein [Planctomonas sp. JC2975]NNC12291.1 hypothetical protein [Planctomonas sp. JC2975]
MKTLLHSLSLAVASGLTAEFLLGDQYLGGMAPAGQQIAQIILFTAFYGSAAILIRELARRARAGWPGILTLALAFGVLEEGVITQSLFNPGYVGAHMLDFGFVPWLGTAGPWLIYVLTLHVVWSIGSPIAVMEGAFGRRSWMRSGWLAVPAVLFVLGAAAIFFVSVAAGGFMANGVQLGVCVAIAAVLIVVTFTVLRGRTTSDGDPLPVTRSRRRSTVRRGFGAGIAAGFVLGSLFQLTSQIPHTVSPWVPVVLLVVIIVAGIVFAYLVRPDAVGMGSGAILTYCWVGLSRAVQTGPAAVIEQVVLVLITLAVLAIVAVRHLRATGSSEARAPESGSPEVANDARA